MFVVLMRKARESQTLLVLSSPLPSLRAVSVTSLMGLFYPHVLAQLDLV